MISSSVNLLSCPFVPAAGGLPMSSTKCWAWKAPSFSEQSLITAHLDYVSGHREEPLGTVDLNVVLAAVGHIAADDDVKAGAGNGELRVAAEVANYLNSPERYLAILIH